MDTLTLQTATGAPVTAVAGTLALFALFLSLTVHIATWNVLGDMELKEAFAVGPVPAAITVTFTSFGWNSFIVSALAFGLDFGFVKHLYDRSTRLSAYAVVIHFVVSVLLGLVLFNLSAVLLTAPF